MPGGAAAASDRGIITFDTSVGIFAVHPDGSGLHQLIPVRGARDARWSPDGRRFVYTQYHEINAYRRGWNYINPVMVLCSSDGRHCRVLTRGIEPRWTPDGRSILFAAPKNGIDPGLREDSRIRRYDLRTGRVSDFGVDGSPYSLSPDLTQVVTFAGVTLVGPKSRPVEVDNYTITTLATGKTTTFSLPRPLYWGQALFWLSNGLVAWDCQQDYSRSKRTDADVCLADPRSPRPRVRGEFDAQYEGKHIYDRQIDFSPSGRRVVVSGAGGVYTATARGRFLHWLYRNPAFNGSDNPFNPDWQRL